MPWSASVLVLPVEEATWTYWLNLGVLTMAAMVYLAFSYLGADIAGMLTTYARD